MVLALGLGGLLTAMRASAPVGGQASVGPRGTLAAASAAGQLDGLVLDAADRLQLTPTATAPAAEAPFALAGWLIGPRQPLTSPTASLLAEWTGQAPSGTAVRLELRGETPDGRFTPWEEVGAGPVTLAEPAVAAQYRLTLLAASPVHSPQVTDVTLRPAPYLADQVTPRPTIATFRLYATRIGLVGNRTSNGHIVVPDDRFVALPSRRVLASNGGTEYQVRVEYKSQNIVIPVWDTGPWNVRDNFWDHPTRRDMWNDLPTGRAQAAAAYFDLYNGGRDGFGRRVLSPAAIDLADGSFRDLGLDHSDWVTATMLWLPIRPS